MELNVFCKSKTFGITEDRLPSSMVFNERQTIFKLLAEEMKSFSGQPPSNELERPKGPDCFPVGAPRSILKMKPASEIEPVMSWGLFIAGAAALASTGFLFVMAATGGIDLG